MPNTCSKPASALLLGHRVRIEGLENDIHRLQRSYDVLLEKYNAVSDQLNQLQRGGKFYNINYLLQNIIQSIIRII